MSRFGALKCGRKVFSSTRTTEKKRSGFLWALLFLVWTLFHIFNWKDKSYQRQHDSLIPSSVFVVPQGGWVGLHHQSHSYLCVPSAPLKRLSWAFTCSVSRFHFFFCLAEWENFSHHVSEREGRERHTPNATPLSHHAHIVNPLAFFGHEPADNNVQHLPLRDVLVSHIFFKRISHPRRPKNSSFASSYTTVLFCGCQ